MITAKEALRRSLQNEYVVNWLQEASKEIEEAIESGESFIAKKIDKCQNAVIYSLRLEGFKVKGFYIGAEVSGLRISWINPDEIFDFTDTGTKEYQESVKEEAKKEPRKALYKGFKMR